MAVYQNRKIDDLTPTQVAELRALRGKMTAREAGLRFNRAADTVRRIWRGEAYREGFQTSDQQLDAVLQEDAVMLKHRMEVRELMQRQQAPDEQPSEPPADEHPNVVAWKKRVGIYK